MAKLCVEDRISIDIRQWHQRGLMALGKNICWHWQRAGAKIKEIFFMTIEMDSKRVVLRSKHPLKGEDFEYIEQPIRLTYTEPNYGGERAWFLCPAISCGRKVAILYKAGRYFVCRTCCGFAYRSQRINRSRRPSKRVRKKRWIFLKSFDGHYEYVEVLQKLHEVLKSGRKSDSPPVRKLVVDISMASPVDSASKPSVHQAPKRDAPAAKRTEPKLNCDDTSSSKPSVRHEPEPIAPPAKTTETRLNWNDTPSQKSNPEKQRQQNLLLERYWAKRRARPVCARCGDPIVTDPVEIHGVDYHRDCSKIARSAIFPTLRFD